MNSEMNITRASSAALITDVSHHAANDTILDARMKDVFHSAQVSLWRRLMGLFGWEVNKRVGAEKYKSGKESDLYDPYKAVNELKRRVEFHTQHGRKYDPTRDSQPEASISYYSSGSPSSVYNITNKANRNG